MVSYEHLPEAVRIWRDMQKDPDMVTGITLYQLDKLAAGAIELMAEDQIRNSISVATWLSITQADFTNFPALLEAVKTLLNIRMVRARLDELVDEL